MTLRDKVKQVNPECVGDCFRGGVKHCPHNYDYINANDICNENKGECEACWSREYVDVVPANCGAKMLKKSVMTLREKVMQVNPECINVKRSGGVIGCPNDYPYLNRPDLSSFSPNCFSDLADRPCEVCWNQPFVGEAVEPVSLGSDINVITDFNSDNCKSCKS